MLNCTRSINSVTPTRVRFSTPSCALARGSVRVRCSISAFTPSVTTGRNSNAKLASSRLP
ncbi:MAG: hypothetical protein HC933_11130 [Pleurocapsa sp. SU_196_0]|nr:hypothetical protein [Pleurocapsa sp. SU_196_0]